MAERRDLLAVQTLRNWTMGASFLASTAVVTIMGLPCGEKLSGIRSPGMATPSRLLKKGLTDELCSH